jgi:hypothetical protein
MGKQQTKELQGKGDQHQAKGPKGEGKHQAQRLQGTALQRQNTEISKQIFPEKEYRGLSPNFHIHAYVSDLYISMIGLPILLEEICRLIL